jgi:hypothetical protein
MRDAFKQVDELNKNQKTLDVSMLSVDEKRLSADDDKLARRKQWITYLSKDVYINETCQIVTDMIKQGMLVKAN